MDCARLEKAVGYLLDHMTQPVKVASVARHVGTTPSTLDRLFRDALGMSPGRYLQQMRLQEAKRLLACTSFSVKEICTNVGIADPNYFCRLFRLREGVSPITYPMHQIGSANSAYLCSH